MAKAKAGLVDITSRLDAYCTQKACLIAPALSAMQGIAFLLCSKTRKTSAA